MRVYLMTDLEGVAGVWKWEQRDDGSPENIDYRMRARRLLTAEVNAAVEGFFEGGATDVVVNDGHGAGYTIDIENVDPRVTIIHGRERPFWLPLLDSTFDATAIVGAHARAGTKFANLCHSMNLSIRRYTFNGKEHGEIGMQALIAGYYGVPMVFLSGDWYACREVSGFVRGIETVAVKQGLSSLSSATLAPPEARRRIREGAVRGMAKAGDIKPYSVGEPILFTEERYEETFDPGNPPKVGVVADPFKREIEANTIIELFNKYYGYSVEQPEFYELG